MGLNGLFSNPLAVLCFNAAVSLVIARWIYYPVAQKRRFLFTYIVSSNLIFLLCYALRNMQLSLEFALALFAVMGLVRCRTEPISIKEMIYLLLVIGLAVINALAHDRVTSAELLAANFLLIAITVAAERLCLLKHECSETITYEKIEMIKPGKHNELIRELRSRTGLAIHRLEIGRLDFLRDTAQVRIFYFDQPGSSVIYEEAPLRFVKASAAGGKAGLPVRRGSHCRKG